MKESRKDEAMEMLDKEIQYRLNQLADYEVGTEEHTALLKTITELYKLRIDENSKSAEAEALKSQKNERWVKVLISGMELVVPLVCYGHWFNKGLKFEETGSVSSSFMRNLMQKFKPIKK